MDTAAARYLHVAAQMSRSLRCATQIVNVMESSNRSNGVQGSIRSGFGVVARLEEGIPCRRAGVVADLFWDGSAKPLEEEVGRFGRDAKGEIAPECLAQKLEFSETNTRFRLRTAPPLTAAIQPSLWRTASSALGAGSRALR